MNDVEQYALAHILRSPRGRTILTFLKELAVDEALAATKNVDRDESFAHSQRAAGILAAHAQLEALTTGDYARTELSNDADG